MSARAGSMDGNEMAEVTGREAKHGFLFVKANQDAASVNAQPASSCTLDKANFLKEHGQHLVWLHCTLSTPQELVIHFKKNCYFGFGFVFPDLKASTRASIQGLIDYLIYQYETLHNTARTHLLHNSTARNQEICSCQRRCNKGHMTAIATCTSPCRRRRPNRMVAWLC